MVNVSLRQKIHFYNNNTRYVKGKYFGEPFCDFFQRERESTNKRVETPVIVQII